VLTDKQILGPDVTDITLLLDILPAGEAKSSISPAMARILSYYYVPGLHLVRTPRCIGFNMPPYHVIVTRGLRSKSNIVVGFCAPKLMPKYDDSRSLICVVFNRPDFGKWFYAPQGLGGPRTQMMDWARDLFGDTKSVKILWPRVLAVMSASLMSHSAEEPCLLVTNDQQLLTHQADIQKMFLGHPVHIVTEAEALRILDLYQKQIHRYWLRPNCKVIHGRYGWYWSAAQADLPNVSDRSTLSRAMHIRYAVDALGNAYYGNADSSDSEESAYHFDYLLVLLTATLDETALQVADHHQLKMRRDRVSMRPPRKGQTEGDHVDFYNQVCAANPRLSELWMQSAAFLQLLYSLRDTVAHLEILGQFASDYVPRYSGQHMIAIDLSNWTTRHGETAQEMFEEAVDLPSPFEPCTSLGVLPIGPAQTALRLSFLVEPYHFSVEAWSRVGYLLNESAKLIGSPIQIQDTVDDPKNWPRNWTRTFKDQALDGLQLNVPHH